MNFETAYGLSLIAFSAGALTTIWGVHRADKRRAAAERNERRREYNLRMSTRN